MKNSRKVTPKDVWFALAAGAFFLACIATSHRTARTLHQGQVSASASYLQDRPADELFGEEVVPIQLAALDARVGIAKGFDMGLAHTWDLEHNAFSRFAYRLTALEAELFVDGQTYRTTETLACGICHGRVESSALSETRERGLLLELINQGSVSLRSES